MVYVNSISVLPKHIVLRIGTRSYAASAKAYPSNADSKTVNWYSNDPNIARVDPLNGSIEASAAGKTRVYAIATDGSGCCDYVTVTVVDKVPVTSMTLNHHNLTISKGQNLRIFATVRPNNATNKCVTWTSSNDGVAKVNDGVVTAVSEGSAIISATTVDGNMIDSCVVTVDSRETNTVITSVYYSSSFNKFIDGKL